MKLPIASHTFLRDWDNCPHKAYRRFIKKDLPKFVGTAETKWGDEVHTAFEVRIKHGTAFPPGMERFEPIAAPLVAAGARAERMLGINVAGWACDFFAPDVWLRGKIDATVVQTAPLFSEPGGCHALVAAIFDWKSGKRREERAELEVHGVLLKAWQPTVQKITAHYVWLQDNEVGKAYDVSNTEAKLAEIRSVMNTVHNCMEIENFPKRRNPLCGWCDVLDCENNTKGR